MNGTERMKELVKKLNEAAKAYYQEDREIMSNLEYDTLYDELQVLEEKTGVTLAGSPTTKVGYEAMDELPKEAHESPMLPLIKRKMWKCSAASSGITKRCCPGRWTV